MHSQAPSKGKTIYFGTIVHSLSLEELEICENGAVGVNEQGKITFFEKETRLSVVLVLHPEWTEAQVVKGPSCGFFFPGFIGTFHAFEITMIMILSSDILNEL